MCADDDRLPVTRRALVAGSAAGLLLTLAGCSAEPKGAVVPAAAVTRHAVASMHPAGFDRTARSRDDPASIWVVVDKHRPLRPRDWVPQDLVAPRVPHTNAPLLRRQAARSLERMFAAARQDGVGLVSLSAYRPFTVQQRIYDRNLRTIGRAATEKLTLRPGYSEHQTGLAIDLGAATREQDLQVGFAHTSASRWLLAHSWRYGFVLRYQQHWTHVTGIQYEPWHYRFVGTALARAYRDSGLHTLEQFFSLPSAPNYA